MALAAPVRVPISRPPPSATRLRVREPQRTMDLLSVLGLLVSAAAVLVGQHLEGGHVSMLLSGPAMLTVFGGTVGAVMLQSPLPVFVHAVRMAPWVIVPPAQPVAEGIRRIVGWSRVARKEGLLGLESTADEEGDAFAQKGLQLLVDGSEPETIRATLEVDLGTRERRDLAAARVFEGMGGYAPAVGIIGAVVGLVHATGGFADPGESGEHLAAACVAAIYGIALANLLFLPAARKLESVACERSQFRRMLVDGLVAIAEGENPRNIEVRLLGYLD